MSITQRQTIGTARWLVYEGCNAYTAHGAVNLEGTNATEWNAAAEGRSKALAQEAGFVCNKDDNCQGFTYDGVNMLYWKLTSVDPSGFRRGQKGFTVYVKEECLKANAAKRRSDYVRKQMLTRFDRYIGNENWVQYEWYNAFSGAGATNIEGETAAEWDAAATQRTAATLSEAKEQCDEDRDCHGFTYDPEALMFWKLKDVDPRGFRRAYRQEYHVYVKEAADLAYKAKVEDENRNAKNAVALKNVAQMQVAALQAQAGGKGNMAFKGGGILGNAAYAEQDIDVSADARNLMKNVQATLLSYPAKASSQASVVSAPAKASAPFWEPMPGKGAGKIDGEGKTKSEPKGKGKDASKAESQASKFNAEGSIQSSPVVKGKGKGPPKGEGPPRRKPKTTPPKTPSTITLHGPGFTMGREDEVLEACQDVAFMEGFNWPDYAVIIQENLCHVEWPSPEIAITFCNATGRTLSINDKSFTVRQPALAAPTAQSSGTEAGTSVETISEGKRVQIQNLTGAKDLNGKFATVGSFNEATGRYIVILEENAKMQKSLKPDNLKCVLPAMAAAKSKAAPPNQPSSLTGYVEGTRVVIDDLTGKDSYEIGAVDMNGKIAIVKSFDKETGRYTVELEEQKGMVYNKLKPGNLTPLDTGMTELERRKKRALGGTNDVADALKGVNGDMWANFVNMFGNEPEQKRKKPED